MKKIALCGNGCCGKDTVAKIIADEDPSFRLGKTTSMVLADYVAEVLREPVHEVFFDRRKNRKLWKDIGDSVREKFGHDIFIREAMKTSDIIIGIRTKSELLVLKQLGILTMWVERQDCSNDKTIEFCKHDCDIILENNSSQAELVRRIMALLTITKQN